MTLAGSKNPDCSDEMSQPNLALSQGNLTLRGVLTIEFGTGRDSLILPTRQFYQMQTANTQALRGYAQDADVAETPRFENGFPYPLPGDPESVFVNAAFMVIAEPRNRKILELLRLMPMTEAELRDFVHLGDFESGASLHDLMATGLVQASGEKRGRYYTLDRQGFSRITNWLAAFELWPQGPF